MDFFYGFLLWISLWLTHHLLTETNTELVLFNFFQQQQKSEKPMLKLALIDELRQDFCMTEPNYILVRLTDNDHFVADVRVLFEYEDRHTQVVIEKLSDDYANLSFIFAPEQIIVIVLMTILHNFTDEHEFYDQIFYTHDDESIRLDAINPFAK